MSQNMLGSITRRSSSSIMACSSASALADRLVAAAIDARGSNARRAEEVTSVHGLSLPKIAA